MSRGGADAPLLLRENDDLWTNENTQQILIWSGDQEMSDDQDGVLKEQCGSLMCSVWKQYQALIHRQYSSFIV